MFKLKRWLALLAIGVIGGVGLMNRGSAKAETYDGNVSDFKILRIIKSNDGNEDKGDLNSLETRYGNMIRYKTQYQFSAKSSFIHKGKKLKLALISVKTNSNVFDNACINGVLGQAGGGLNDSDVYTKEGQKIGSVHRSSQPTDGNTQEYYVEFTDEPSINMIGMQTFVIKPSGNRAFNYGTSPRTFSGYSKIDGNVYFKDSYGNVVKTLPIHMKSPDVSHGLLKYVGGKPEFRGNGVNQSGYNSGYANFTDAFYKVWNNNRGIWADNLNTSYNTQSNIQLCQDMTVITNNDENLTSILRYQSCADKKTGNRALDKVGDTATVGYRIRIPIVHKGYFIDDGLDLEFNFPWLTWFNHGDNATNLPITRVKDGMSINDLKNMLNEDKSKTQGLLSVQGKTRYVMVYNITPDWLKKQVSMILDHANDDGGIIDKDFYYASQSNAEQKNIINETRAFLNKKLYGYMRFDIWGTGTFYKYPQLTKKVTESDYTLNTNSPFVMKNGDYVEKATSPLDVTLQDGQGGLMIHTIDADSGNELSVPPKTMAGWENTTASINAKKYVPDGYSLVYVRNGKNPVQVEGKESIALSSNANIKFPQRNTWKNVYIYCTKRKDPAKTASTDKVSFDGKPFTYDVKQQVNNLNSDIFEKYSQMSFDDKIPDSLKVNDVQILDGDGKDVKDGAGKLSTSYNGEKNHVHFDFNKNYLDSMKMNGETYTMRISCTYVAHKLYDSEKEINNTATVNINDEPKTASVKINVPENPPKGRNQDPAFSKTTATKTFDGTKDQTVSYTLTANYGNQRLPWGSSITDNMPDNCTLDVSSIKAQYVDEMNGAKKEDINVNDYFTNESTDKQLRLVMNKDKDGKKDSTHMFINSQLIVKYNMKIKGNAVWSGGYKDNDGKAYYNSQTDKIVVPNVATFIDSQDNGQAFKAFALISTSAKHAGLTKRANVGSFDYSKDQTVKYSLNADFGNLHNPNGASVEDNLPDNCTLDRNSVKATRIASDGTTHAVNIADFFTDYSTDKKIKLVLNKGNVNEFVNSKLVVTYDMKIKGNSDWSNYYDKDTHNIRVPNSATFIDGQGGQKFTDTVSVTTDCQEPSITAYIAQDDNNFVQGDKKVHYNEHSGDSSTKAVTVAYKIVVGNYLKLRQLEVKSSVPNGFRVVSSTLRNSLTNANEGFGYQNHTNLNADNVSDNCPHIQDHGERAQSWVGKTAYWIVKTNASVANYAEYANLASNTGAFRGEMLTGAGNYGKDPWHYSNTVGAIVPNVYEYQPLASEQFANRTLKYYAKVKGLSVNVQAPTSFSNQGQPVKLNNSTVSLPDGIKTNQSQNIVASVTNASKNANVTVANDLSNPNKAVVITNKNCETKAVDNGIRNDFDSQPKTIAKANALYLNPYKQINYYDYDNHVIARKELNEAYVFNAKYEHPKAKGGYGIVNPNGLTVVGFSNPESENVQSKYKTIFTDKDNLADVGYLAKHGNSYTEALDFDKSVKTVDEKSIDSVLSKDKLNATDKTKNLKRDVLGYETSADGKETRHELKLSRENELHLTPQAYALHIDYKFNHRYLNNGKQLFVNADNRYSNYNSNNGSVTTGDDGGNRLYLKNWLKDGDYQTNYSLNNIGYRNRMSLNLNQPIQIYGRRYLSKTRGFNTGGEISVQPTISDSDYHVSGGNADLQGWLGSY